MPAFANPDTWLPLSLVGLVLAIVLMLWRLRARMLRRMARRRTAGYQLMDCLKAYTVWIDWHREETMLHQDPDNMGVPAALNRALQIKDQHFPELSRLLLQLLQTHRELMAYLWEENILRTGGAARPHYADPRYHALRDRQDAALDSLFLRCRELIGDGDTQWKRTRSDFNFSSGLGMPSHPQPPL